MPPPGCRWVIGIKEISLVKLSSFFLGLFLCGILSVAALTVSANERFVGRVDQQKLSGVKALLDIREAEVDFARAKLTIDKMIDPSVDVEHELSRLNRIVQKIRSSGAQTSLQKKDALRYYLYQAGEWNGHRPFTYDFDDPKGTNIGNKLLSRYLDSRKGNCISMPFLFIVLAQKLNLDVSASTAPLHVFVKFTDDVSGITYNLETTSGANVTRDAWLRQGFPMTDTALKEGIYLQKLSKSETVAVMAITLLQDYFEKKDYAQLIATADLILDVYPKAISAIIYKAAAYTQILKERKLWHYRKPQDVPAQKQAAFKYLVSRINQLNRRAVKLGWRPPNQAAEEEYLRKIRQQD